MRLIGASTLRRERPARALGRPGRPDSFWWYSFGRCQPRKCPCPRRRRSSGVGSSSVRATLGPKRRWPRDRRTCCRRFRGESGDAERRRSGLGRRDSTRPTTSPPSSSSPIPSCGRSARSRPVRSPTSPRRPARSWGRCRGMRSMYGRREERLDVVVADARAAIAAACGVAVPDDPAAPAWQSRARLRA